jgi:hypothetical protein
MTKVVIEGACVMHMICGLHVSNKVEFCNFINDI